jgi:hypothetical protein
MMAAVMIAVPISGRAGRPALLALLIGLVVLPACDEGLPAGSPPLAALQAPPLCDLGSSILLDASGSTDPDNDIVLYRFVVADGTAARDETQPRIDHVCRLAGLIEAAVEVVDAAGHSDWARIVISVRRP